MIFKRPRRRTGVAKSRLAFPPVPASAGPNREDRNVNRTAKVRGLRARVTGRPRAFYHKANTCLSTEGAAAPGKEDDDV